MSDVVSVEVPDIGDFTDIPVIEILVGPGDTVAVDDPLLTLESDKATMDVPALFAGTVRELRVGVGDRVSQGALLLTMEPTGDGIGQKGVSDRFRGSAGGSSRTRVREQRPGGRGGRGPSPQPPAGSGRRPSFRLRQPVRSPSGPRTRGRAWPL